MRDISLGGLAAMLDAPVAVGQRLWLEFRLPGAEAPIRILSKVRHDFGQRFGFQFLNITPEQRESIRKCCETLPNI